MASFQITRRNGDVYTVLVDDEDLERVLAAGPWHVVRNRGAFYVQHSVRARGVATKLVLHRWLLGAESGANVDHRNGDTLDNRKGNLRECSQSENMRNRRGNVDNVSGLKGSGRMRDSGKYRARITVNGKQVYLGLFDTAEEAHEAYRRAAEKAFGEFARFA